MVVSCGAWYDVHLHSMQAGPCHCDHRHHDFTGYHLYLCAGQDTRRAGHDQLFAISDARARRRKDHRPGSSLSSWATCASHVPARRNCRLHCCGLDTLSNRGTALSATIVSNLVPSSGHDRSRKSSPVHCSSLSDLNIPYGRALLAFHGGCVVCTDSLAIGRRSSEESMVSTFANARRNRAAKCSSRNVL